MIKCFSLLFLLLSSVVYAEDYSPHVAITVNSNSETRMYSGTVFAQDKDSYYIITCAHGTMDLPKTKIIIKTTVRKEPKTSIEGVIVQPVFMFEDKDPDLCVMKFRKSSHVKVKPIKLANASLLIGVECDSYGYVMDQFRVDKVSTITKDGKCIQDGQEVRYLDDTGNPVLRCAGKAISGKSGGSLVKDDQIFGIQSAGEGNEITYCPSTVAIQFLKRYNHAVLLDN